MSFSFSFSGNDIEDDSPDDLATKLKNTNITPPSATTLLQPQRHTLAELLESLPSQVSYNYLDVPIQDDTADQGNQSAKIRVPRREIHDIRQQLMAEADVEDAAATSTDNLLGGLATGDLSTGIYEGGFKTWECAVDLAGFVAPRAHSMDRMSEWHVIELGAGSAIPSLVLLQRLLRARIGAAGILQEQDRGGRKLRFTLCDYNEDVLRLCTAVNVFLTVLLNSTKAGFEKGDELDDGEGYGTEEGNIEVDEPLTQTALRMLYDANIEIDFISGAWSDAFLQLLHQRQQTPQEESTLQNRPHTLVLASETIYSLDSLGPFSRVVMNTLESVQRAEAGKVEAFVAAKQVYFGVGGGIAEFEEKIKMLGGRTRTALNAKGAGVGRVVLEVSVS